VPHEAPHQCADPRRRFADETQAPEFPYDVGRRLRPLRDDDVLLMGTGNLVHNLHTYAWGGRPVDRTIGPCVSKRSHAADDADALVFPVEGVDGGSVSTLTVQLG
jgi:hypothetical protein